MEISEALQQQKLQYKHDQRNHADILYLGKVERMKHYALHFAKYVARIMRDDKIPYDRTLVDALLVSLSCANTLNLNLSEAADRRDSVSADNREFIVKFADHMGRLADACEKIDHLEPFEHIARDASSAVYFVLAEEFGRRGLNAGELLADRRAQLSCRPVYLD